MAMTRKVGTHHPKTLLLKKNVMESGFIFESIHKIQYYVQMTSLYQTMKMVEIKHNNGF